MTAQGRRSRRASKENEPRCEGMSLSQEQLPAPATTWSSSLALHRHPRRDATPPGTEHRAPTAYVAQVLLVLLTNISHSGGDEVQSDKASCQPRLEAPVFSSDLDGLRK